MPLVGGKENWVESTELVIQALKKFLSVNLGVLYHEIYTARNLLRSRWYLGCRTWNTDLSLASSLFLISMVLVIKQNNPSRSLLVSPLAIRGQGRFILPNISSQPLSAVALPGEHMKRLIPLLIFLVLVGCSQVPQSGNVSVSCNYVINPDKTVDLQHCVPVLPATFTPQPTTTSLPTSLPPATTVPPFATPTRIAGPTVTAGPTATSHPGSAMQGVIRNGLSDRVRIRNCAGMSENDPFKCPQAQAQSKDGVLEPAWMMPGTAFQIYRVHWPYNTSSYVWASLSPDSISSQRWWAAVCFNNSAYLELYSMGWYTGTDVLGRWYEGWLANPADNKVPSCSMPQG